MARQTVEGPYRVKNFGVDGDLYEVVEMVDEAKNSFEYLRPRRTYLKRESAYQAMARLNRRWQKAQLESDD